MKAKPLYFIYLLSVFLSLSLSVFPATIILTSDKQLDDLQNPDTKIDLSTGLTKRFASLREICEEAKGKAIKPW